MAEIVAKNYEASGGRGEAETEAWKKENTQAGREEGALSFSKDLDDFQDWEFEFGCMSWLDSKNIPCAWSREGEGGWMVCSSIWSPAFHFTVLRILATKLVVGCSTCRLHC